MAQTTARRPCWLSRFNQFSSDLFITSPNTLSILSFSCSYPLLISPVSLCYQFWHLVVFLQVIQLIDFRRCIGVTEEGATKWWIWRILCFGLNPDLRGFVGYFGMGILWVLAICPLDWYFSDLLGILQVSIRNSVLVCFGHHDFRGSLGILAWEFCGFWAFVRQFSICAIDWEFCKFLSGPLF